MSYIGYGFHQLLTGNSGVKSLVLQDDGSNGIYMYKAPDKAKMPYIVCNEITHMAKLKFSGQIEDIKFQVSIFDNHKSEINGWNIRQAVFTALNRQTITYSSGTVQHVGCIYDQDIGPVPNNDYWQRYIQFKVRYT